MAKVGIELGSPTLLENVLTLGQRGGTPRNNNVTQSCRELVARKTTVQSRPRCAYGTHLLIRTASTSFLDWLVSRMIVLVGSWSEVVEGRLV